MSKKVVGIVLTVASIALIATGVGAPLGLGTLGIALGAGAFISDAVLLGIGLGIAGSLLMGSVKPKGLRTGSTDRLTATLIPTDPRKIAFGITALATDVRYQAFTGSGQEYLNQIVCVASHQVQSIDEIWLDNEKAWTSAGGAQGRYAGYLTVTPVTLGTSANGIAIDANWTASCTLTGCAYVYLQYRMTGTSSKVQSPFSAGVTSRMTIRGHGAKVYDPRLDSTVAGGSGAQRAADQTTWAWNDNASRNPALQELFYELGWKINGKLAVGKGVPPSRLDLASYAVAANACDESIALNGGGTEPRYRSDGIVSEGDDPGAVRDHLCQTMNAVLRDAGGKLALKVIVNDLATPVTPSGRSAFDENDVLGATQWDQTPSLASSFNIIRGRRIDPSDNALYQPVDFPEVSLASPDGIDRIDTIDYPFVQSNGQVQRLAKQRLQRNQYQGRLSFTGGPAFWGISLGDVFPLTHAAFGWSGKLFRCVGHTMSRTGPVQIIALEENAAIYAWGNNEAAAVTPGAPTVYNPLNNPLVLGVGDAATTATWPNITGVGKPQDNATVGAIIGPGGNTTGAVDTNGRALIDFSQPVHIGKNVDNLADGATYSRTLASRVNAGRPTIDFSEGIHPNKTLTNIADDANFARIATSRVNASRPTIDFSETIHSNQSLVNNSNVGAYAALGDANRVSFWDVRGGTTGWSLQYNPSSLSGTTGTVTVGGRNTFYGNFTWTAANQRFQIGTVLDANYFIPVVPGEYVFVGARINFTPGASGAGWSLSLNVYDSAGAYLTTVGATSSLIDPGGGRIGGIVQIPASVVVGGVTKYPFQANIIAEANNYSSGAVSSALYITNAMVTSAGANQTSFPGEAPGIRGDTQDSVPDTASYARVATGELTGGLVKLGVAGSGKRLGDLRNSPALLSSGNRYIYNQTPTYSAPTTNTSNVGTSTITLAAGTLTIGSASVNYPTMSVGVSGTGSTTYTYNLYGDDPAYSGSTTLVATTGSVAVSAADGRIYFGQCTITYPASGATAPAGSGTGGGGTIACVVLETYLPRNGIAGDVTAGDRLLIGNALTFEERLGLVSNARRELVECVRFSTASGIALECSTTAPIAVEGGECVNAPDLLGRRIPVRDFGEWRIEEVVSVEVIGLRWVMHITCEDDTFLAGRAEGRYVLHHNVKP